MFPSFLPSLLLDSVRGSFDKLCCTRTRPLIIAKGAAASTEISVKHDQARPNTRQHGNDQRERPRAALDELPLQWRAPPRRPCRCTPAVRRISFPLLSPLSLAPRSRRIPGRTRVSFRRRVRGQSLKVRDRGRRRHICRQSQGGIRG